MNLTTQLITTFFVCLISAVLLTKILINILTHFAIVDAPRGRHAHRKVTPLGGGISLVLIFIPVILSWNLVTDISYTKHFLVVFSLISLISFIDDLKNTHVSLRLMVHLGCALAALWLYLAPNLLFQQCLPNALDFILAAICLTAFLNIYNFMDGIDGITASESIHLSITILMICFFHQKVILHVDLIKIIATTILGWSLGFLLFNWQPASIFIGDVGSISLGFLLGICLILIAASGQKFFVSSLIMCLYYIGDGGLTILIRLFKREKIWQPHLQHFFQKAVKKGMSHKMVASRIIFCNLLLMILSMTCLHFSILSFTLAIIVVSVTLWQFAK